MRRFDRVAGLVAALHRCIRTASDVSDARAWYVRDALKRYVRLAGGREMSAAKVSAYVLAEARRLGTACGCCDEIDDPNGPGPAINTGFCVECTKAGCPDRQVGDPCVAVTP